VDDGICVHYILKIKPIGLAVSNMSNNEKLPRARFCASCGARTEWTIRAGDHCPVELCPVCGAVFFRNSVPCAGALIVEDNRLLLIRRTIEPFRGFWDVPGGFLEEGEHPKEGAVRETMEETGLKVRPERFIGIYIDRYCGDGSCTTLNIYYLCSVESGEPQPLDEADKVEWFPIDLLPKRIAFPDHVMNVLIDLKDSLNVGFEGKGRCVF
jgi:ADP-ribose pyrophosphatase YjhB (NUDIX family)